MVERAFGEGIGERDGAAGRPDRRRSRIDPRRVAARDRHGYGGHGDRRVCAVHRCWPRASHAQAARASSNRTSTTDARPGRSCRPSCRRRRRESDLRAVQRQRRVAPIASRSIAKSIDDRQRRRLPLHRSWRRARRACATSATKASVARRARRSSTRPVSADGTWVTGALGGVDADRGSAATTASRPRSMKEYFCIDAYPTRSMRDDPGHGSTSIVPSTIWYGRARRLRRRHRATEQDQVGPGGSARARRRSRAATRSRSTRGRMMRRASPLA